MVRSAFEIFLKSISLFYVKDFHPEKRNTFSSENCIFYGKCATIESITSIYSMSAESSSYTIEKNTSMDYRDLMKDFDAIPGFPKLSSESISKLNSLLPENQNGLKIALSDQARNFNDGLGSIKNRVRSSEAGVFIDGINVA
ncbi:MAG: hypothetical protein HHAS10_06050 [Candidatus Altimarinota bacterium]